MTVSEKKHQAIVDAAIELFHDHGFAKTRMDDIAEQAAVSKRTVYKHFPSKEALFFEIVQNMMRLFSPLEQSTVLNSELALEQQLVVLLKQQVDLLCEPRLLKLSKLILAATLNNDVDMSEVQQRLDKPIGELQMWLEQQLDAEIISANSAAELEQWLLAILKGRLFWPQLVQYREAPDQAEKLAISEQLARMFLSEYSA